MTQALDYKPGLQDIILNYFKIKVDNLTEISKYCILCADGMSIKSNFFSTKCDTVIGFHDTGPVKQLLPATTVLVLMARGLYNNWKQILGYFFSTSGSSGNSLCAIIKDCIGKLQNIGLVMYVLTTDMGSNFIQLSRMLNVDKSQPYFKVNEQKIFYIFDTPHIFKAIRICL